MFEMILSAVIGGAVTAVLAAVANFITMKSNQETILFRLSAMEEKIDNYNKENDALNDRLYRAEQKNSNMEILISKMEKETA